MLSSRNRREQLVAEVVVRGDVAPAAAAGIAREHMRAAHQPAGEARQAAFHGIQQVAVAHQDAHQRGQVAAVPAAIDVRLAAADTAGESQLPVEGRIAHPHGGVQRLRRIRRGRAQHHVAIRVDHAQLAVAQRPRLVQHALAQQARHAARRRQRLRVETSAVSSRGKASVTESFIPRELPSGASYALFGGDDRPDCPPATIRKACQWMAATTLRVMKG